jgi:hypothetical protein
MKRSVRCESLFSRIDRYLHIVDPDMRFEPTPNATHLMYQIKIRRVFKLSMYVQGR